MIHCEDVRKIGAKREEKGVGEEGRREVKDGWINVPLRFWWALPMFDILPIWWLDALRVLRSEGGNTDGCLKGSMARKVGRGMLLLC